MSQKQLIRTCVALATACVILTGAGTALATPTPTVSVRVEGARGTLLPVVRVHTRRGSSARDGHAVAGRSALGALNLATRGRWSGTWSTAYSEWELTGILGETHRFSSKYFWAVYVNHVQASTGAGQLRLRRGDALVFAALPDSDFNEPLIGARGPGTVRAGRAFRVTVVDYNARGRARALKGATVSCGGRSARTDAAGVAHLRVAAAGRRTIRVAKRGYVRDELRVRVRV